jgi:hypothetical protein
MQRCFCVSILCTTISAEECYPRPFLFSQAIYSAMGVHDCGWWLGRDIATVVWWAYVLYYAWRELKSGRTMSLSFLSWLVAGLVAGLFWEVVWLVAALSVVCINSFPWKSYRIDTAPPESQVVPTAPPESLMPTAPPESQVLSIAPLPVAQAVEPRPGIYPRAVVVPTAVVVARAPGMDVAAVSIDLPIRKAAGWKRV